MLALVQRVLRAEVTADGTVTGSIQKGLLVYLGVFAEDSEADAAQLARKLVRLRIFSDEEDKLNLSVTDVGGGILAISNFTLCGHIKSSGNRPSYSKAERPQRADALYEEFLAALAREGVPAQKGVFGADMQIDAVADGPVNFILDTRTM